MEQKKIGIIYRYSSDWIAGAYYIENLLSAMAMLVGYNLPLVYLFAENNEQFERVKGISNYPYLKFVKYKQRLNLFEKVIAKTFHCITLGNYAPFKTIDMDKYGLSMLFPYDYLCMKSESRLISWIPDLQEKYLMQLFSQKELHNRDNRIKKLIDLNRTIVFSSRDSENDFVKFYPGAANKRFVLPFVVKHPDYSSQNIDDLKNKFKITKQYIFCANQYWKHKNHLFLFKAFAKAKSMGLDMQLVCSGKMYDYRDNEYPSKLNEFISQNGLEEDIMNIGFIDRREQLCLMKNSYALIQPSLFEGWNTTVEDAKCMNKFIFLSNLKVHIEQAPVNVCYFDPNNENDLVQKLLNTKITSIQYDYTENVRKFGERFLKIVEEY